MASLPLLTLVTLCGIISPVVANMTTSGQYQFPTAHASDQGFCEQTTIDKGWIHSLDCKGYVEISTITRMIVISCDKLTNQVVVGPVLLKFSSCVYRGTGMPTCLPGSSVGFLGYEPCSHFTRPVDALTVMLIVILTLVNYVIMRYIWIRLKFKPAGCTVLSRSSGIIKFEIAYTRKIAPGSRYHSEAERAIIEGVPKSKYFYQFNFKTLLLLILFFTLPRALKAFNVGRNLSLGISHLGTSLVSEGSQIENDGWVFKILKAHDELVLAPGYWSAEYISKLIGDWHCTSACIVNGGVCRGFGPTGVVRDSGKLKVDRGKQTASFFHDFCMPGTTGCFASNGCWRWSIETVINFKTLYSVHHIVGVTPIVEYEILSRGENEEPAIQMVPARLSSRSCIVRTHTQSTYYCASCSDIEYPEENKMGDIQISNNSSVIVSRFHAICVHDNVEGPQCSTVKSSMPRVLSACTNLNSQAKNGFRLLNSGAVAYTPENGALITINTDTRTEMELDVEKCGTPLFDLWVVLSSEHQGILSAHTPRSVKGHTMSWKDPCSETMWEIPCDGGHHHHSVSWPFSCYSSLPGVVMHSSTASLDNFNEDIHLGWEDGSVSKFWKEDSWLSVFHLPGLLGGLSVNLIVLVIVLVLVCRR